MAEYIDKSDTETVFREIRKRLSAKKKDYEAIEFLIKYQMLSVAEEVIHAIPAADVRPVVTCGKCKYGKYTGTEWFCDKHSGHADKFGEDASYHEYHSKHWFCADGEKREKS